jgi:hypothetical protein
MIRRLVEADYAALGKNASPVQVRFWLAEARTPELLVELAERFPAECLTMADARPLLRQPLDAVRLRDLLWEEEQTERAADREYWAPLKRELEAMRRTI